MTPEQRQVVERLGQNVRRLRTARGLNAEALAARAGIHRTQISFLENGQRSPRILTFLKLCGALEVTPNELLDGVSWEPGRPARGTFVTADADKGGT